MSSVFKYTSCPVSQLHLLEPIGPQTQVESFKDIEYLPTSAIQDGVPITFEIGKDKRFTDLSELVIKTVVEIQGENGTILTGKQFTNVESAGTLEEVGVINNLGHSLWEQIVLTINDTKVTESSNNYAYQAMLETLLAMMMLTRRVFCVCLVLRKTMETLLQNSPQQHMKTRDL